MEFVQQLGGLSYLGVFGISLLANVVLPFPEEITLLALGYLSGLGVFHMVFIIPIAMLGLFINDTLLYALSYKGSRITQLFYNKMFAKRFDFLQKLSDRKKLEQVIVIARFLPYFRFLAPFLSGHYKLSFKQFLHHEMISLSIYTTAFVFLGYFLRERIERVMDGIGVFQNITIGIVIIITGIIFFKLLKKYFMKYLNLNFLK